MAYFNHAFTKLFIGTHPTQLSVAGVSAGVDRGFLTDAGIPSVQLINTAAPYALGLGVYGLFDPNNYLSVNAASVQVTSGAPLILASTALYQHDKIARFHGGYQESTKSKMINPKYVSRFYRVDPCTPNQNIVHVGHTPYTSDAGVQTVSINNNATTYTNGTYTNVTFTDITGSGSGAQATIVVAGGIITSVAFTTPGTGYDLGDTLNPDLTATGGTNAILTIAVLTPTDPNCCKEFLCGQTYFLRMDVKGSPELRYLSRNGYWTADYNTGCCPADCGVPTAVDSTLVMIGWANQFIQNAIVGPFIQAVVYDENGVAWYAPAAAQIPNQFGLDLSPGIGSVSITAGGTGYVNGTFNNVTFQSNNNGTGAQATITVAGGIVTAVVITNPGMNFKVGDTLTAPLLSPGTGLVLTVATAVVPTWDNYVSPGHQDGKCAGIKFIGAFVDTKFGDCTFYPTDYFEKEPVKILPSEVDETGDVCAFSGLCVVEQCLPRQGNGFGDTVLKDLILSESYMQNYFYNGTDLRIREVTQGYDISSAINRSALYYRYFLQHNVPRFNNPTGVFDNDQYLLQVITVAPSVTFENTIGAWLTACNCNATLELISCGDSCPAVCATITTDANTVLVDGAVGVAYGPFTITPAGGTAPYVFEITSGTLPTGLVLDGATGIVSGTPTVAGSFTFNLTTADADGCEVTETITIVIAP